MTTCVYRDGQCAADTLVTEGPSFRFTQARKWTRNSATQAVCLVAGPAIEAGKLLDRFASYALGTAPDLNLIAGIREVECMIAYRPGNGLGIRLFFGQCRNLRADGSVDEEGFIPILNSTFHAIGSGAKFAMGAMQNGATAAKALEAAAALDPMTGGTLDTFAL